jgi:hypothetical protein
MKESLRSHLELLFEDAPKTRKAFELKEELITNSVERYDDLLKSGVAPEDAYKNVVNSLGNVSDLFNGLEETTEEEMKIENEKIKKLALIKAVAVGLYILGAVIFLGFAAIGYNFYPFIDPDVTGLIIMLIIDIVPTCMLVYVSNAYPKYKMVDTTVVEEFKAWKSKNQKNRAVKGAVWMIIWTLTIILYFIISFATMAWYISWIIFLIGICATAITELVFRLKEMEQCEK